MNFRILHVFTEKDYKEHKKCSNKICKLSIVILIKIKNKQDKLLKRHNFKPGKKTKKYQL